MARCRSRPSTRCGASGGGEEGCLCCETAAAAAVGVVSDTSASSSIHCQRCSLAFDGQAPQVEGAKRGRVCARAVVLPTPHSLTRTTRTAAEAEAVAGVQYDTNIHRPQARRAPACISVCTRACFSVGGREGAAAGYEWHEVLAKQRKLALFFAGAFSVPGVFFRFSPPSLSSQSARRCCAASRSASSPRPLSSLRCSCTID